MIVGVQSSSESVADAVSDDAFVVTDVSLDAADAFAFVDEVADALWVEIVLADPALVPTDAETAMADASAAVIDDAAMEDGTDSEPAMVDASVDAARAAAGDVDTRAGTEK